MKWHRNNGLTQVLGAFCLWACFPVAGQQQPALVLQDGHRGSVLAVAFTPDGNTLVSGSDDRTVKVWEMVSGRVQHTLDGHTGWVRSVALSVDGRTLASGADDTTVKVWEVTTGKLLHTLQGHSGEVEAVIFSADGQTLASAADDLTVKVWGLATGKLQRTLEGRGNPEVLVFSPDGRMLALGGGGNVVVWEVATGKLLRTLRKPSHPRGVRMDHLESLAFTPDGRMLATGSHQQGDQQVHALQVWELSTGKVQRTFAGHAAPVNTLAFSPDGQRLASGSCDRTVKVWELATGRLLRALQDGAIVRSVAFSPDGQALAAGSDASAKVWELATGKLLRSLRGQTVPVTALALSPDGQRAVSGAGDGMLRVWDTSTGKLLRSLEGHVSWVNSVAHSAGGKSLASGADDTTVKVWDAATGKLLHTLEGHQGAVNSVALAHNGRLLASAADDAKVKVWDVAKGTLLRTLRAPADEVEHVAFSPDDQILAGSAGQQVKLWKMPKGRHLRTLESTGGKVYSVAFSPDGQTLALGTAGGIVEVWEVAAAKRLLTLEHTDLVNAVAFSPDGQILASGADDGTLGMWQAMTGKLLRTYRGHTDSVESLVFSPDGQTLVSGSWDGRIRYWRVADGDLLATSVASGEDYLTYTREGLYVSSEKGEKLVAWRAGGRVLGSEQYAQFFRRPDLVARRLEGLPVDRPEGPWPMIELRPEPPPLVAERGTKPASEPGDFTREWYKGSYALLIGVSVYTGGWDDLPTIPRELFQLEAELRRHGFYVRKYFDPDAESLEDHFREFINDYGLDPGNRLLFFFAGHGWTRQVGSRQKGYLVPSDAPSPHRDEPAFLRKSLPISDLVQWSKSRIEARHALFLFDSCFSGTAFKARSTLRTSRIVEEMAKPVRQFITAGRADETVPARSDFTPLVVRGIQGAADLYPDGYVTGSELGIYLENEVTNLGKGQTPQAGIIQDPDLNEGDFVFRVPER